MISQPSVSYELQVLDGEQQGARTALPLGLPVSISGAIDSDIVLRGAGLDESRIALTVRGDRLDLQVLQGDVEVDGQLIGAGRSLSVALGAAVSLGGTRVGVVRRDDAPVAPTDATDEAAARPTADAVPPRPNRWPRRLIAGGGALAAVSIGMLAFAYTLAPTPPTAEQQARRAEAVLHGAGLQRLSVRAAGAGDIRVDGYLETAAQRAQAERLLEEERIPARWQVWVNEQVSSAVQDVYRVNGVTARVEAVGPGAVRVHTSVADPLSLDPILSIARRDVPGLAAVDVRNELRPAATGPLPSIDDPGKRVASIVPGDPPYVVTVDGTRYFEGALLPTGQRIAGIDEHQVVLELNGVRTPLVF